MGMRKFKALQRTKETHKKPSIFATIENILPTFPRI